VRTDTGRFATKNAVRMDAGSATPSIYFSDVFEIDPVLLESYGAFNVALVNDLPLFVDPFLLYDSRNRTYRELHDNIIKYLCFLRDHAISGDLTEGAMLQWLYFKEIKQNWLGFSRAGNSGTGLGRKFAVALVRNLKDAFRNFGTETISRSSHLEKLSLLDGGVGRDHLSDFTTNLIKEFLLNYTQTFALRELDAAQRRRTNVQRVRFNYDTQRWEAAYFELPFFNNDYVILTPKDILTRDDAWINQGDMLNHFGEICVALPDESLRTQINEHFYRQINKRSTKKEQRTAALKTIEKFNTILDHYIKLKEDNAEGAHRQSSRKVRETELQFIQNIRTLVRDYLAGSNFYELDTSYAESLERVKFLKHVIEDKDGYRIFHIDGKPVQREEDLQLMFKLTWFRTQYDVNTEVNNGRGPVDAKISKGRENANLVEFKLAKNTSLEKNLRNQVKIYEKASDADKSIKVIMYFSDKELEKVRRILKKLTLEGREDIILIDAGPKVSASKVDE
jgi:CRISPR/Cas system CSM-associated protein Csm4 (group 5 of RAMP superfamily)